MARLIRLNEAFTDITLPILQDDPILNSGSLLLNEPAHPANPLAAGVPASGSSIPNIAWKQAAALLGSGSQSSLASTLNYNGISATANTIGKVERSTKGGIHGILTQSAYTTGTPGMQVPSSTAIYDYLRNNPTHVMLFSIWGMFTRAPRSDMSGALALVQFGRYSTGVVGAAYLGVLLSQLYPQGGNRTGTRAEGVSGSLSGASGKFLYNVAGIGNDAAGSSWTGILPTGSGYSAANWGANSLANGSGFDNKWPSFVWYRTYIEDITVSAAAAGRTVAQQYAAQDAIDKFLYDKHVGVSPAAGVTSRYYGDTVPTAPSTIA